jgi:penicillin-binding protein 2
LVIGLMLISLGSAYFRTQIIQNEDFTLRSNSNRLRAITIPAARGAIYDRNGVPIAETVTTYSLFLEALPPHETEVVLGRLRERLALSDSAVAAMLEERRKEPRKPLPVAKDLGFDQVSWIEEHRLELPGIHIDEIPLRRYPHGEAVAHLVGYVGEISERELADSVHWPGYRMGQMVGKSGIERQYDRVLGGEDGERYVEVDARGKVIGTLAPSESKEPIAGHDIRLTIDVRLQRFAHSIWPEEMNGAIVAMVPSTGEVLALYSHPTFDPNRLIGGIPRELWRSLNTDKRRPLLNRTTDGIYAPGSTFKIATALIGLERGIITPTTRMPLPCTGGMSYAGRYSRCWKPEGHGFLDLAGAIANSCNVYFYQLGIWLGLNRLATEGTRLGFSRETGIDLPGESSGTFPSGADWYKKRFGWNPTPSEVMSLAIGQGPNAQTPLRVAQFFSALAGDGTAPAPHLLMGPPSRTPETDLRVTPETLREVRVGLARVTEPGGTAYFASLRRWKLYGKTGSSENSQDPSRTHAWFAGFAGPPGQEPEIAVAAVVEFGGHGGTAAAPIAAKVADFYLNEIHGFKTDPEHQTLAERTGR